MKFYDRGIRVINEPAKAGWRFLHFETQMKVRLVFLLYGYQFSTLKQVYHIWLYEPHFHPVAQRGEGKKNLFIVVPLSHRASDVVHI